MRIKGKPDLKVSTGVDPVCPKCGPYEPSEGTYSGHGQRKNRGRQGRKPTGPFIPKKLNKNE